MIGRYEVLGRLATGGMAEILLGRMTGPRAFVQPVAIKRILPHLAENRAFVDMFVEEARIAADIRHARVVQVHEFAYHDGELFLVMEYVEGESLGGIMRRLWLRREQLDRALAAHVVAEACAGLHAAHELTDAAGIGRNVVHRDVSPQNVMVTYGGEVKVLDFGIAKVSDSARTQTGQLKGKCEYMSPEQCRGEALDRRSDIFALGILLYELTVGRRLFKRENALLTFEAICRKPIPTPSEVSPGYPECLEAVCTRALARLPHERYATALEMRRDLEAAVRRIGGTHRRAGEEEELARLMHRLFPDRIEEKREMLRRARAGSSLGRVPTAEADAAVDIPDVTHASRRSGLESHAGTTSPGSARRGWRYPAIAAGVLGVLAAVGVFTFGPPWRRPRPPAGEVQTSASASSAAPVAARREEPVPTPAPSVIALSVESVPPGARVGVAGQPRGATPCTVQLARGDEAIAIEISRAGFQAIVERVVPNADQRLVIHLKPAVVRKAKKRTGSPSPPRRSGPVVFERFD